MGRMRLCRVFARMDCLSGVVALLPQVCSACQVKPFAVMGIIVCSTCKRMCSLRCIGCLIVSTCCHGFVVCSVGEKCLSLWRCAMLYLIQCCCTCVLLWRVPCVLQHLVSGHRGPPPHQLALHGLDNWDPQRGLCFSLIFEQFHFLRHLWNFVVSYACGDCECLDCICFFERESKQHRHLWFQHSSIC